MKILPALLLGSLLIGCATVEPIPNKRPLNAESIKAIGKVKVAAAENNRGVEKSWFMTDSSAAGAQYGLLGALVTSVMDAIMNAGPSKRAQKAANEIAALVPADALNVSLMYHLQSQVPAADAVTTGIAINEVAMTQKVLAPKPVNDVVEVATSYTLSEDASAFRFVAHVTYQSSKLAYATPYQFKGAVPKDQLTGPLYSNTFTYQSAQLPIPTLTPDLKTRLIASIQDSYKTDTGAPPAPDSQDGKALAKELEAARDDEAHQGRDRHLPDAQLVERWRSPAQARNRERARLRREVHRSRSQLHRRPQCRLATMSWWKPSPAAVLFDAWAPVPKRAHMLPRRAT